MGFPGIMAGVRKMDEQRVEELTGLYGPVFFAEKQVQRIWATRSFRLEGLITRSGKRIEVLDPGRWNFQEGPDFRDAILEFDGRRKHGDVEIHLHERDWVRHGHGEDPNFFNVALHVVLFPDRRREAASSSESHIETLEWLKYLDRDLETYFEDQGVDQLLDEGLPKPLDQLLDLPVEAREQVLVAAAWERWERKVKIVAKRIGLAGLPDTTHQMMLEILGLRRNRATMSRLAVTFPSSRWQASTPDLAATAFETFREDWHLAACRPANHPFRRLIAYAEWRNSGRMAEVREVFARPPKFRSGATVTAQRVRRWRKESGLSKRESEWRKIFDPAVRGSRFHTWVGDGFLPLLAASHKNHDFSTQWFVWPVGDIPERMKNALKTLEITGPGRPLCNGWTQGIIRCLEPDYLLPH